MVVKRVGRALDLFALDNMVHGDAGEERERWVSWSGIVSFWVLAPLAVFGAVRTRRRDRAVLLIPVVIALATTVSFTAVIASGRLPNRRSWSSPRSQSIA